ncbi:hypothetical protein, partial [Anaerorhabdus sp.]|uniref:hypothetical protein n=1 Tax=Anaerorhabdus sp. TaxID=1872524 RepID=UPI002FC7243C
ERGAQILKGYTFKELLTILSIGNGKIRYYSNQIPNDLEVKKKCKFIMNCTTIFTFMYCMPFILISATGLLSINLKSQFNIYLIYLFIIEVALSAVFIIYFRRNASRDLILIVNTIKQYFEE